MRKHRRERPAVEVDGLRSGSSRATAAALAPVVPTAVVGAAVVPPARDRAGGYRLVRVLGEGRSAVVHLGAAGSGAHDAPAATAAIKLYRPGIPAGRIDAEIEALGAVDHPHLLRLVDLATTDDRVPCLVLERCEPGGLARLVAEGHELSRGEAVTVLAPLVAAVAALHAAGYVHRDIRLTNVLFRDSGAPVLCGFGAAAPIAGARSPAGLAANDDVLDDRRQLLLVVRAVLERVDEPVGAPLDEWLGRHAVDSDDFCPRLEGALFDLAEPQPVRLRERASASGAAHVVRPQARLPAQEIRVRSPVTHSVATAARWLLQQARGVRRRYWSIAVGVGVCLVVAAVAIPQHPGPRSGSERVQPSSAGSPTPHAQATSPSVPDGTEPSDDAIEGDDPVAALVALLDERRRCVRELSVLCLDAVVQPASSALEGDSAVIRGLQAGGEQTPDATVEANGPVLVERLGDSALLDLGDVPQTQPASALVMRGEAGWRIRDYLGPVVSSD